MSVREVWESPTKEGGTGVSVGMEGRQLPQAQPPLPSAIQWGKQDFKGNCPRERTTFSLILTGCSWKAPLLEKRYGPLKAPNPEVAQRYGYLPLLESVLRSRD